MAMETQHFDSSEEETALANVLTPSSREKSLYVRIPVLETDRRTDGGATDRNTVTVQFNEDVSSYERGEYVTLTFTPNKYGNGHVLTHVERADFTDPTNVDEETFPNTDIPVICPVCGERAAAVVKSQYDSMTGGKVDNNANSCTVLPENRGAWFGFNGEMSFVHETNETVK